MRWGEFKSVFLTSYVLIRQITHVIEAFFFYQERSFQRFLRLSTNKHKRKQNICFGVVLFAHLEAKKKRFVSSFFFSLGRIAYRSR
jgi:hypothetical protein